jgi:uncharacterized protein DUF6511
MRWAASTPGGHRSAGAPRPRGAGEARPAGPGASTTAATRTCALCGREAKGLGYVHQLRFERYPHHRFCSAGCFEPGCAIARKANGMIDTTEMEARAVKDARRALAKVLTELGLLEAFRNRSAAEIDRVIEACIDGFQASMRRQAKERAA